MCNGHNVADLPRWHPSHPSRQACERVANTWQEKHHQVRRQPAAGGHRPHRGWARLLWDGPSELHSSLSRFALCCCNYDNGEISRVWQWTTDTAPRENNVTLKINVTNSFSLPLFSPSHSPSSKIHREIKGIHNMEMAVIQKNISILSYSVLSVLL